MDTLIRQEMNEWQHKAELRFYNLARDWTMWQKWTGLVSMFYGISSFDGFLMPKPSFKKNSSDTI